MGRIRYSEADSPDPQHPAAREFVDVSWQDEALCQGRTDLFYSERNSTNRTTKLLTSDRKAKALCARCPVRKECLTYAMTPKKLMTPDAVLRVIDMERDGIWGGTMPWERRRMKEFGVDWILDAMFDQAVGMGLVDREGAA